MAGACNLVISTVQRLINDTTPQKKMMMAGKLKIVLVIIIQQHPQEKLERQSYHSTDPLWVRCPNLVQRNFPGKRADELET